MAVQSGADSPHIMDLDVDRPIDFDEKNQKILCEQYFVKKFEALLNACSISCILLKNSYHGVEGGSSILR